MIALYLTTMAFSSEFRVTSEDDLNAAVGNLQAGDSLLFASGDFVLSENLAFEFSGTAGAPITIRGEDGAAIVIAGGASIGLSLNGSIWVNIENLTIRGDSDWESGSYTGISLSGVEDVSVSSVHIHSIGSHGVIINGGSERVVVQDSEISNTVDGSGIYVGCGDEEDSSCYTEEGTLSHNWIHDISGENKSAINLRHGTQSVNAIDNVIYNIQSTGIWMGSTEGGIQNSANANAIWNIGGAGIAIRGAAMVRNNVVFNTEGSGIITVNPERDTYNTMVISFNTVANTASWGMVLNDWDLADGSVLANNAVYNPSGRSIRMTYDETGNHPDTINFITTNMINGWADGLDELSDHFATGNGWIDFIDIEGWNFYPASGSAILDQANPDGDTYIPSYDFNGVAREGGTPDIGAYEFDGTVNPGWAIQEGFKSFELNYPIEDNVIGGCRQKKSTQALALFLIPFAMFFRRRDSA